MARSDFFLKSIVKMTVFKRVLLNCSIFTSVRAFGMNTIFSHLKKLILLMVALVMVGITLWYWTAQTRYSGEGHR